MPIYQYRGRSGQGQSVTGQLDAASESAAADMLLARGIIPLEVKVAKVVKSFSLAQLFG